MCVAFGLLLVTWRSDDHFFAFLVTMISAAIILTFTMVEFIDYRRVHTDTSIIVDRSRGEKLNVVFNITFPRVPCYRA